jgi:hypothetical protein
MESSNDRTETLQEFRPESPLLETNSPRVRRSVSPSIGVKYDNIYSLSHASTSSSPHLQLPRTTVLRRTLSSSSFKTIPGLDYDSANFGEDIYEYNDHDHDQHDHHSHDSEKDHILSHENYHENGSHNYDHFHNANVKQLPTLSHIFSSLFPSQKTLFTWGTIHLFLGILLWLKGQWGCGLGIL